MAILNYTTTIQAEKTIGEISTILAKAKAREVSFEYDKDGDAVAIKFAIEFLGSLVWYRLSPNYEGVLEAMKRDKVPPKYKNGRQAFNTAWRILKDAIEAQMAIVQSNQGEVAEVFLPYAYDGTQTFFQMFKEGKQKQLTAGNGA